MSTDTRGRGRQPLSADSPTVTVSLRMPAALRDRLYLLAAARETTAAAMVRREIERMVAR